MIEKYLIDCMYLNWNIKDEIVAEVKFDGKIFRGTLTELEKVKK
jgi:hypothetical protein